MRSLKLTLAYDGTAYAGWQRQANGLSIQQVVDSHNRSGLEVDGGIDATTAPLAVDAGADVLVAGSAIFNDGESVAVAMQRLRAALKH